MVDHTHLMRRLYHYGVQDRHWSLISDMHKNASSIVKWTGETSDPFDVNLGVRQGGILSASLYKVHINPALHRIQNSNLGTKIGTVYCGTTACTDDLTVGSKQPCEGQTMVSETQDFSSMERYDLQPVKSVSFSVTPVNSKNSSTTDFEINGQKLSCVDVATHLGIKRGTSISKTGDENVNRNICKARRTAYSLFASGLHGHNGLDPQTSLQLIKIYILPVLLYGLEIVILNKSQIERLELYQKKNCWNRSYRFL